MGLINIHIAALMQTSGVKFGTSGARGLVSDMTDRVCYAYTLAFLQHLRDLGDIQAGDKVAVAGDLRPSSPRIKAAVGAAITDAGFVAVDCGWVPTPALALYAMQRGMAGVMVTGSHIPDDRNGIKFYKPSGEILKQDEQSIAGRSLTLPRQRFTDHGQLCEPFTFVDSTALAHAEYVSRFTSFFAADLLQGKQVGVYEHSSVARQMMVEVLQALGAQVVRLGRSDTFIPVDTEAVRDEDVILAKQWAVDFDLDAIVSSDGDGDRPLISDEHGEWLRGDVAGIICARYLQATAVVTPVSSNTALEASHYFAHTQRTQIGSPFVIAAMQDYVRNGEKSVVGYEANGGFLTATCVQHDGRMLAALPTRDALIVPLCILAAGIEAGQSIRQLCNTLPQRFTQSGRVQDFPVAASQAKLAPLQQGDANQRRQTATLLLDHILGDVADVDITDGIRMTFASAEIVHLRPSGNAPELRCYVEAASPDRADALLAMGMALLNTWKLAA